MYLGQTVSSRLVLCRPDPGRGIGAALIGTWRPDDNGADSLQPLATHGSLWTRAGPEIHGNMDVMPSISGNSQTFVDVSRP